MNDWHMALGRLLLRAALAAPVSLMARLIRRDIRREAPSERSPGQS